MVEVQSSWFPLYDRNPQKFVPNIMTAKPEDYQKATVTILADEAHPSGVVLPVVHQIEISLSARLGKTPVSRNPSFGERSFNRKTFSVDFDVAAPSIVRRDSTEIVFTGRRFRSLNFLVRTAFLIAVG